MTIWQELGIDATEDAGAIKSAYAARLKATRPENDPEGFQRLRAAYTAALRLAGQTGPSVVPMPRPEEAETAVLERPADTPPPDAVETLRARDETIQSLRQVFASGDGEASVAAIDAAVARQLLPIDAEVQFVNALVAVLYNDRTIPARRLLEIAKRFGWYGVPDQLRGPNGRGERTLCARIDAELWLENMRSLAKSWKYWIGEREPAAARMVLGLRLAGLTWFAPPEPALSRKVAEALLHEPQLGGVIDTDRLKGIRRILMIRQKRFVRTLIMAGRMAFIFALAVIGLYFNPRATMGVIVTMFVWGRMPGSFRINYRTELIFPLIALVWVVLSILYAEIYLPPQTYED